MSQKMISETKRIKDYALKLGADLLGVADASSLKGIDTYVPNLFVSFPRAISIAVRVEKFGSRAEEINSSFTKQIELLEKIALRVSNFIHDKGFKTLIIHPEDRIDPAGERGLISNKAVAKAAGIGWLGKSLLLVTLKYGPRVRLVSIFTNMPLIPDNPLECQCKDCHICIDACPEKALKNVEFVDHPRRREEVLDFTKCKGESGCKVCMLTCPLGIRKR
jgi:epoxyqueuosine reductase